MAYATSEPSAQETVKTTGPVDVVHQGLVDLIHVERLREFIQAQLDEPQLYAVPDVDFYLLVGRELILRVAKYLNFDRETGTSTDTWAMAFCIGVGQLRRNDGGSQCVKLPRGQVVARTVREVRRDRNLRHQSRSWGRVLPKIDRPAQLRASLAKFHDFIRCTNQLELLIRDAEIFRYRIVSSSRDRTTERVVVVGRERCAGIG